MRLGRIVTAAWLTLTVCWCVWPALLVAQFQSPSEKLLISASAASTWSQGQENVIQLQGPVTIELDRATLSASEAAVVWLSRVPGAVLELQHAQIALIGDAKVAQGSVVRSGPSMLVDVDVRGTIRITAEQRAARNLSDSEAYQQAQKVRQRGGGGGGGAGEAEITVVASSLPATQPSVEAPLPPSGAAAAPPAPTTTTTLVPSAEPVGFSFGHIESFLTPEHRVAVALTQGVTLFQHRANGGFIELHADRAVVFTTLSNLRLAVTSQSEQMRLSDAVVAAYLEGDVRIIYTPPGINAADQRLEAERVYYEFTTDRAILTDAVLHTIEPRRQIPVVLRAQVIRQLAQREYRAEDVELSTSSFATPSYSIKADRAYVRTYDTRNPRLGDRTVFTANNATLNVFELPVFYLPSVAGSMTDRGSPLRSLGISHTRVFGTGVLSEWGLFETLGQLPPPGLDMSYRLDYFSDRGPAAGLDAAYFGGFVTETTHDPWNFSGNFTSYMVYDHGDDDLGRRRLDVEPPDEFRGHVLWEHQHFFPEDWQVQLRAGYVSDPTFLEEWFEDDFDTGQPHELAAYVKRQRQTEAFTLLTTVQPNEFVTAYEYQQEQFEIERIPELGYHRIGDSLLDDQLTFFSDNTLAGLRFDPSEATLAEQGFRASQSPGIPSVGTTGVTDDTVYRGDFRQEIDWPFTAGQFRFVPYVVGRYSAYSDSPDGDAKDRLYAGTGVRVTTAFWKVDDSAYSKLFDIHRLRHVVEPQVHLYTSAQTTDRDELFIYDEPVDAITDITAAQVALRQRWQTKRGGPGLWRSVDFFTLNIEGNFFANQPSDNELEPTEFRGLFFDSLPEASIPRDSVNADALWRISDSTAVLADAQYNLDEGELATASIGLAARRDEYLSYFVGTRYIEVLNSNITTVAVTYQLTPKYTIGVSGSYDFGEGDRVRNSLTLTRKFDRFFMAVQVYRDETNDESGFTFNLYPEGITQGLGSNGLRNVFD